MSSIEEVKKRVGELVYERGLSFNNIALRLGKNPSYLQKFVKEKSPKRLDETFRRGLAQILGVDEQELTDLPISHALPPSVSGTQALANKITSLFASDKIKIDILDVTACCGSGNDIAQEQVTGAWQMSTADFRAISLTSDPKNIKMIKTCGDSMAPTINEGDWCLVDISLNSLLSDGLYLIRLSSGLAVKRIQGGLGENITVKSDNPQYDPINAALSDINIIGRVIYILNAKKV